MLQKIASDHDWGVMENRVSTQILGLKQRMAIDAEDGN